MSESELPREEYESGEGGATGKKEIHKLKEMRRKRGREEVSFTR